MRRDLLGIPVDLLDFEQTVEKGVDAMRLGNQCVHVALNAAKLVKAQDSDELHRDIRSADIVGIDGMAISWALQFLGGGQSPRVAGADLMIALLEQCNREGFRPYILGAKPDVLAQAIGQAQIRWPNIQFAGSHHGYFSPEEEMAIVRDVNQSKADCLFLAMPTPKKERFMSMHRKNLNVSFIMGVGGTVDILAGHVRRAPIWMQRYGLEWLFRIFQEPRKMFMRYFSTNFRFIWMVVKAKVSSR